MGDEPEEGDESSPPADPSPGSDDGGVATPGSDGPDGSSSRAPPDEDGEGDEGTEEDEPDPAEPDTESPDDGAESPDEIETEGDEPADGADATDGSTESTEEGEGETGAPSDDDGEGTADSTDGADDWESEVDEEALRAAIGVGYDAELEPAGDAGDDGSDPAAVGEGEGDAATADVTDGDEGEGAPQAATDGEGVGATALDAATAGADYGEEVEAPGYGGLDGPESDTEMPLADHIEEMLKRLAVVVAVAGVVSLLVFPFAERLINLLWYSILPGAAGDIARPRVYGILELKLTELKVASLAGLIVALPVLVYETFQFMRPGLYPHERRYYLAAIPTSLVLALVGVSFAYFVVLPAIFSYFLYYSQDVANIGFALGKTFNLILVMMGYLALVFQIPLFIMLAMMMGLVTRRWLADRRLLFWGGFLGISFIFSPDPTGMAPVMIALTMVALFEGTLLLTKWAGRR